MDAVAYPDASVISFVNQYLIPLRIDSSDKKLSTAFQIRWTPTLLVLDADGEEHYRTLGFYPPQDLIPSLLLGMGKTYFDKSDRQSAIGCFSRILGDFPRSAMAPEALYHKGVCGYLESHDVSNLIGMHDRMVSDYPDSPWVTRSSPYKLLKKG